MGNVGPTPISKPLTSSHLQSPFALDGHVVTGSGIQVWVGWVQSDPWPTGVRVWDSSDTEVRGEVLTSLGSEL
jgi:hypothetical protein